MTFVTDLADPRRCKFSFPRQQCRNLAVPGSKYCKLHDHRTGVLSEETRLYHLAEIDNRRRLSELSSDESIKSLREEIGLVRMLIEKMLNTAKTDAELLSACGSINNMLLTLDKLIKSCHTLEQSLGELLSKDSVMRTAQSICEIVIEELQGIEGHEEVIDRIVERLFPSNKKEMVALLSLTSPEPLDAE